MIRQVALLGVLVLVGVSVTTARGATDAATWLPSPARTLAELDCRCVPNSARTARYRRLFDRLSTGCQESRGRLAYISTVATEGLRQSGHRRTNLWMLTRVDQMISGGTTQKQPCRYVFALIVTSIR